VDGLAKLLLMEYKLLYAKKKKSEVEHHEEEKPTGRRYGRRSRRPRRARKQRQPRKSRTEMINEYKQESIGLTDTEDISNEKPDYSEVTIPW
jgi:hypothetical protein